MTFLWPGFIVLLASIPILIALHVAALRRRRKAALIYSSLALVRAALPQPGRVRRYLPPALFLLALASLTGALARPAVTNQVPSVETTVILVMDVSGSMRFTDIQPTRLAAAEAAALSFVRRESSTTQIGIVAFSSVAQLIQPPTADRDQLEAAIRSLTVGDSTAIGSGLLKGLEIIAQMNQQPLPSLATINRDPSATPPAPKAYTPEIIVLLTDGDNNDGPYPLDVARLAASQGVRIYTIGYGPEPTSTHIQNNPFRDPQNLIPDTGGGNGNKSGFDAFLAYDAEALQTIARLTGGKSYAATGASSLEKVFASLPIQTVIRTETQEISVAFVALGALLTMAALLLAALWNPLP